MEAIDAPMEAIDAPVEAIQEGPMETVTAATYQESEYGREHCVKEGDGELEAAEIEEKEEHKSSGMLRGLDGYESENGAGFMMETEEMSTIGECDSSERMFNTYKMEGVEGSDIECKDDEVMATVGERESREMLRELKGYGSEDDDECTTESEEMSTSTIGEHNNSEQLMKKNEVEDGEGSEYDYKGEHGNISFGDETDDDTQLMTSLKKSIEMAIAEECENCGREAYAYCDDCQNYYCQGCCSTRHQNPRRRMHKINRLSAIKPMCSMLSVVEEERPIAINEQLELQVTGKLVKHFQFSRLKDWQMKTIQATIEGRNTIIIQPTGSGKSLCFQLPPLITGKTTIVITPTISLMQDQTASLTEKGIKATYLGSTQKDPQALTLLKEGALDIAFVTVERFFARGGVDTVFTIMVAEEKIGLIAIDEAHLIYSWKSFRPQYAQLLQLSTLFPNLPLMALTATAPPAVLDKIHHVIPRPFMVRASVNQPNITYRVIKQVTGGKGKEQQLRNTVSQIIPLINEKKAIIYLDFSKDVDSLTIALREAGVESCSYKGQSMSGHDKTRVIENWRRGDMKVMVCTSAFGMGVNQPDVDIVLHIGVPPNIESMVQEFGRAGRDGRQAEGVILFTESDLYHADFWCKTNNPDEVLQQFAKSWRYVLSNLAGICRRRVILDAFGENEVTPTTSGTCCDVCESPREGIADCQAEITTILRAVTEIPGNGEVNLAEYIRGSSSKTSLSLRQKATLGQSFGSGREFGHSLEHWRLLIRQAWLSNLLSREMKQGMGRRMVTGVIFNVFHISKKGEAFLEKNHAIHLPTPLLESPALSISNQKKKTTITRKGAGSQALPIIRGLLLTAEKWFPINSCDDYHFPGVFRLPPPKRLGYCRDITQLSSHEESDPDFMFSDIQLGKGKARNQREVKVSIDGEEEEVVYRIVPCGGVKQCLHYGEDCQYVVSTREIKKCPKHPGEQLVKSSPPCPVEFVYIRPKDPSDHRRWLTGIVRSGELDDQNLHNHPIHGETKITANVDADIRRAVITNPHLKTKDIIVGNGMQYMPGAASLAATHRGKIKNIRLSTLRDSSQNVDQRVCILDFEKEATAYDKDQKKCATGKGEHLDEYSSLGHPYVVDYCLTSSLNWVLLMNPLMKKELSKADFIEVDVTFKASVELDYMFNAVTFNYTTLRWMTVARVYLNKLTADAYHKCFSSMFSAVSSAYPEFEVGKSLVGIIMDWSDQQFSGLELTVGKEVAESIVKGCQVHFKRSVKRVAYTVCKGDSLAYNAFKMIGYHTLKATSEDEIKTLFSVLGGSAGIDEAMKYITSSDCLQKYAPHHKCANWEPAAKWCEWWTRPRHLNMLSASVGSMKPSTFTALPSSTNAVESLHRGVKGKHADILKVALMTVYKLDMASTLEHIAASKNIPTSYEQLTPHVREKKAKVTKRARAKRMREDDNDDLEGPPDKRKHFVKHQLAKSSLKLSKPASSAKQFKSSHKLSKSISSAKSPLKLSKPASSAKQSKSSRKLSRYTSSAKSPLKLTKPASSAKQSKSSRKLSRYTSSAKSPLKLAKTTSSSSAKSFFELTPTSPASPSLRKLSKSTSSPKSSLKLSKSTLSDKLSQTSPKQPTVLPSSVKVSKSIPEENKSAKISQSLPNQVHPTSAAELSIRSCKSLSNHATIKSSAEPSNFSSEQGKLSKSSIKSSAEPSKLSSKQGNLSKSFLDQAAKPISSVTSHPVDEHQGNVRVPCNCRSRCNGSKRCSCRALGFACLPECHVGHACTNNHSECIISSVDLTEIDSADESPNKPKAGRSCKKWTEIGDVQLKEYHKNILMSGAWLDDLLVCAAQCLLQIQHPHIGGFQNTVLATNLSMEPQTCEFIQVLNVNQNHWITISNIGCSSPFSIKVYDSLGGRLPIATKRIVADLLQCQKRNITVLYEDVKHQVGSNDCGCFAIAYATTLCNGKDPSKAVYDQKAMRAHLFHALNEGELTEFPTQGKRRPSKSTTQRIPVYCLCRLLDDGSEMILCSHCDEWYHTSCVNVDKKYIENRELVWTCQKCR